MSLFYQMLFALIIIKNMVKLFDLVKVVKMNWGETHLLSSFINDKRLLIFYYSEIDNQNHEVTLELAEPIKLI